MIITLCGSTRFKDEYIEVAKNLALDGHAVLSVNLFAHADGIELTTEQKLRLDNAHKQKILLSDAIFVINKDGYIGESTYSEIDWAQRLKKEVYFLVDPSEDKDKDKDTLTTTEEITNDIDNSIEEE